MHFGVQYILLSVFISYIIIEVGNIYLPMCTGVAARSGPLSEQLHALPTWGEEMGGPMVCPHLQNTRLLSGPHSENSAYTYYMYAVIACPEF